MKYIIFFLLVLSGYLATAQSILPLRADTVVIEKTGGNGELKIKNSTRDSLGLLVNIGGGRTQFIRARALNDSTVIIGKDTIIIKGTGGIANNFVTADLTLAAALRQHSFGNNEMRFKYNITAPISEGYVSFGTPNKKGLNILGDNSGSELVGLHFSDPNLPSSTGQTYFSNGILNFNAFTGSNGAEWSVGPTSMKMAVIQGALSRGIDLTKALPDTGINVFDEIGNTGMYYNGDYSVNGLARHGDRWIPDWGAVNGAISGAGNVFFKQNLNTFGDTARLGTSDNQALKIETNGLPRITILNNGNVAIGRQSTSYKFQVDSGSAALRDLSITGFQTTAWSRAGITGITRFDTLGTSTGAFGSFIEDLSNIKMNAGFGGYGGYYSTAYHYSATPITPAAGAYIAGLSSLPVYDNASGGALPFMYGYYSSPNVANLSTVTVMADFYIKDYNTASRVAANGPTAVVNDHYGLYMEQFNKGTRKYGIAIDGTQSSWTLGKWSLGTKTDTANILNLNGALATESITSTTTLGSTSGGNIGLYAAALPTGANQVLGTIEFGSRNGASAFNTGIRLRAQTNGAWTDGSAEQAYFTVETNATGTLNEVMRWTANGRVSIGNIANPNSRLQIAAGSTALVPLTLTSGTVATTPVAGAEEYDGTSRFFTPGSTRLRYVLSDNAIPTAGQIAVGDATNYTVSSVFTIESISTTGTTTLAATVKMVTIKVDATGGNVTRTITANHIGQVINVKKMDASANTVTIQASSGNIDGGTITLTTQYQNAQLQWDGTNWLNL